MGTTYENAINVEEYEPSVNQDVVVVAGTPPARPEQPRPRHQIREFRRQLQPSPSAFRYKLTALELSALSAFIRRKDAILSGGRRQSVVVAIGVIRRPGAGHANDYPEYVVGAKLTHTNGKITYVVTSFDIRGRRLPEWSETARIKREQVFVNGYHFSPFADMMEDGLQAHMVQFLVL
jgi:hypothetical protein